MDEYTKPTALLDYTNAILAKKREHLLTHVTKPKDKIKILYDFVRSLPLCYTKNDDQPASVSLQQGCGQCNTKAILLVALARGAGIPSRMHAYRLTKEAQRSRAPDWLLAFAPKNTLFFWPEFFVNKTWYSLQEIVFTKEELWDSCPFDGACKQKTPLKQEWILEDQGTYATPDEYFKKYKPTIHGWRKIGWNLVGRRALNSRLRNK